MGPYYADGSLDRHGNQQPGGQRPQRVEEPVDQLANHLNKYTINAIQSKLGSHAVTGLQKLGMLY